MRTVISWLLLILFSQQLAAVEVSDDDIREIFPKATVIGEQDSQYPVRPVYQLQELLGYVFQSNDLVNLPGFSGDKINLLIGLDIEGRIKGLKILSHHEPIFLHGLGPEPMQRFIDQFTGIRVNHRVIVEKAANDKDPNDNTVHIDGVTKATVSVIVINDTILLSSLQVARKMLSDFASPPSATPKDTYTALNWQQLTQQKLVKRWTLTQEDFTRALGTSPQDFPGGTFNLEGSNTFSIYYAYLNAPTIGKNLLGEAEYTRMMRTLKPNEQAFLVMSEGFYHYLEDDFKPGTVSNQISIKQNDLPFTMRDMNFYSFAPQQLADGMSAKDNPQVFVINAQSGFNPSQPMTFVLDLTLAKNPLISVTAQFEDNYALPANLFDFQEVAQAEAPTPPWVRIWASRIPVLIVLVISLILVTAIFVYQHRLSSNERLFRWVRWGFMFYTLFFIGWYTQGQLSVVNIYPIVQDLFDGFDIQVYLMDPVIFILWLYVFISLFIVGRGIFCGWLCPFGALQEMVGWVAKKLRIRQKKIPYAIHSKLWWLKYAILIGLVGVSVMSLHSAEVGAEIEPFKTAITLQFIRDWPFVLYAVGLLVAGLFINKFYCRYVCPLGAGLAILGYFHMGEWLTRRKQCGNPCTLCHHKCDIKAITPKGDINYNECVQCLECIVYYNNDDLCPPLKKAKRENLAVEVS